MTEENYQDQAEQSGRPGPWSRQAAAPLPLATDPVVPARNAAVSFTGDSREFRRLVLHGAWMQFFTFGFYRFWLTTDIRRFIWSHTSVDGEGAEYTGTARELVIGFLFALAVLTPVYLISFIGGIEAERAKAFASLPLGLILVLFGQFAIFRARRYRLTRTVWRGVRFWMDGSGWAYALLSFILYFPVVFSIGLLHPWRVAVLERYKMRHTLYGDIRGSFEGSAWGFFRHGVLLWFFAFVAFGGIIFLASKIGTLLNAFAIASGVVAKPGRAFAVSASTGLVIAVFLILVWSYYRAIEWRWWASCVRIGQARMICRIRGHQLFGLYLKLFGWVVLLAIPLLLIFAAVYLGAVALHGHLLTSLSGDLARFLESNLSIIRIIGSFAAYLVAALAFGVLQRYFLQYHYWKLILANLEIHGVHTLDGAQAHGELAGSLGEGLADGLDVGGF